MLRKYKIYGSQPTNLKLTYKAEEFYTSCDPLEIREYAHAEVVTDNNSDTILYVQTTYTYDLVGCIEDHDLTAGELIDLLENALDNTLLFHSMIQDSE